MREGLAHYLQDRKQRRFLPGRHDTPYRVVLLGHDGPLSIDVLWWLAAHRISVVIRKFLDAEIACIVSSQAAGDSESRCNGRLSASGSSSLTR